MLKLLAFTRRICYNKSVQPHINKGDLVRAYRYGKREQMELFPASIEDYLSQDGPVRAYDAFVEPLDFVGLGIILEEHKVGNSEYFPILCQRTLIEVSL